MPSDRSPARSFRDLRVWQKAHQFVLAVYRYSESFPEREKYGLAHQLRRAAVSIPANIAEGFGKRSPAEKARFLNIAEGSVEECRYYLILSQDLGYGSSESLTATLEETTSCSTPTQTPFSPICCRYTNPDESIRPLFVRAHRR